MAAIKRVVWNSDAIPRVGDGAPTVRNITFGKLSAELSQIIHCDFRDAAAFLPDV